jgi:hypothetical protein
MDDQNSKPKGYMTEQEMEAICKRVEEINEIIRLAYRENRIDIVEQMIDEIKELESRLNHKGYLC